MPAAAAGAQQLQIPAGDGIRGKQRARGIPSRAGGIPAGTPPGAAFEPEPAAGSGNPPADQRLGRGAKSPMKILLIDDDEDIRRIIQLSLERVGGMKVCEAADG